MVEPISPLLLEHVSFVYEGADKAALHDADLALQQGEWLLLCGASGCGKSTIARAATGLIPHFYNGELLGRVLSGGLDTRHHPPYEIFRKAALIFQNPDAQLFNASVEHEIAFGLESLGLTRAEMRARIAEASAAAAISHLLGRAPHTLSGGEKQRVAIASALALRPPLLMLDEPFSHLDAEGAAHVRAALKRVQATGTTVMVIEHRLHDLVADADRLAVASDGRIVACDSPRAVLSLHVEQYGVAPPYPVRLFHERGWDFTPLNTAEALKWRKTHGAAIDSVSDGTSEIVPITGLCPAMRGSAVSRPDTLLVLDGVGYDVDRRPLLNDLSFTIGHGESVALLGRNGAGKTTLLKLLAGLRRPTRGRVIAGGADVAKLSPAAVARQIGLVFQNANDQLFLPNVREEIEAGARRLEEYDGTWLAEVVETLGLRALLARSPFRLSEGEKKRVAIASVLAMRPKLIALDEPTVGQDYRTRQALIGLLHDLRARGHTLLIATHDLELAEEIAPRWLLLAEGRIAAEGTPGSIMADAGLMHMCGVVATDRFYMASHLQVETGRAQSWD